jgi:hypothetical protein
LGVRAFRKSARIAAMLELTTEGKALYEGLSKSIGRSGMDRVAGYARASAEAQILIREEGAEAIEALHASRGNVAAARQALLSRRGVPVGPPQPTPAMLAAIGEPTPTLINRARERPYTNPPGMQVFRGRPLDFSKLDPKKEYVWAVNQQGDFLLAEKQHDPAVFGGGRRTPGEAKHGDLIPGPEGQSRGFARAGGELKFERSATTGELKWRLDNDSSYTFQRMGPDGLQLPHLPASSLDAVRDLLRHYGTDVSEVELVDVLADQR